MDIQNQVFSGQDSGMLGLAFHPEYNQSGSPNKDYFYIYYTAIKDGNHFLRLSRFSGSAVGDPASELIMFEQELGPTLHRGGGLLFGDDGFLYVAVGDLGYMEQAQNLNEMLAGGILRIDVDMRGGNVSHPVRRTLADVSKGVSGIGYYIPNDNPFLDENGVDCGTHLLIRGFEPGEDLVAFAREKEVDEIIIGVKSRSKVGKLLFGSTAQAVILTADCPVVTVK